MASHELKTPLTSIKAYIQLVSKKTGCSRRIILLLPRCSKVENQVNKMTDLIHAFLDLSKLEPGKSAA